MILETKLDENFTAGKFSMDGYSVSFRFDIDGNEGGILLYTREDTPSKIFSINQNNEVFT